MLRYMHKNDLLDALKRSFDKLFKNNQNYQRIITRSYNDYNNNYKTNEANNDGA